MKQTNTKISLRKIFLKDLKVFGIALFSAALGVLCYVAFPNVGIQSEPEPIEQNTDTIIINSNGNDTINAVGNFIINVELEDDFGQMSIHPEYTTDGIFIKTTPFKCIGINVKGGYVPPGEIAAINKYGANRVVFQRDCSKVFVFVYELDLTF